MNDYSSRRKFLKSTALVAGAGLASARESAAVHAAGSNTLKIGLVGCGGRGTMAAVQALTADPHTRLVALADAFGDRLEGGYKLLKKSAVGERVTDSRDMRLVGFDAYKKVIEESDVVLLCTPPQFRPQHLRACVEAGKHVFAEKPVAVDAPGIRSVLESTRLAQEKQLSIVSGLCWRYETGLLETMKRIHDGAIGDVVAVEATRYAGGVWVRNRLPDQTEMEHQMRNWYYYTWLSGDFIVEQFVHQLDQIAWTLGDQWPTKCYCVGGRETRKGEQHGHIFDHFNAVYEYENGVRAYAGTRHQAGCSYLSHCHALGTQGRCDLMQYDITGKNSWKWDGKRTDMHQLEHNAMYEALRAGRTINNGDYMAKSTMMAILARMSAYTGKTISWEQAMNSQQDLSPSSYAWDAQPPPAEVAVPGKTQFV